jgi:hypothetical protein
MIVHLIGFWGPESGAPSTADAGVVALTTDAATSADSASLDRMKAFSLRWVWVDAANNQQAALLFQKLGGRFRPGRSGRPRRRRRALFVSPWPGVTD